MAHTSTNTVESASEQAGRAAGYAEKAAETAQDYAAQVADRIAAIAKDAYDDPQRFLRETQFDITRQTLQNPLQTLAIAAGIGFAIGAILKR
jgi:ElaB/YqjD/DUF883 family membrane-anchored ribosome-binding protein